jgi:hypothetical protein
VASVFDHIAGQGLNDVGRIQDFFLAQGTDRGFFRAVAALGTTFFKSLGFDFDGCFRDLGSFLDGRSFIFSGKVGCIRCRCHRTAAERIYHQHHRYGQNKQPPFSLFLVFQHKDPPSDSVNKNPFSCKVSQGLENHAIEF